jgi:hypothetical protein
VEIPLTSKPVLEVELQHVKQADGTEFTVLRIKE